MVDKLSKPLPRMQPGQYDPKVGETITLQLPDELTRAEIIKIVTPETCLAKLLQYTTSKTHQYRKDEVVPCRYETLTMNQRGWRAVSTRELDDAQAAHKKRKKNAA